MRLARLIVRLSAWLAPGDVRARWREEWLAEIRAAGDAPPATPDSPPRTARRLLVCALGAPIDALAWRLRDLVADGSWSAGWRGDLRDVVREWRRAPIRTVTTFICLTTGLAATLVIFAFVNTMFSGELPGVEDRSTLARVRLMRGGFVDDPDVDEFRAAAAAPFEHLRLAATSRRSYTAVINGEPVELETRLASSSLFDVLGTPPALGRLLQAADDHPEASPAVVISHGLWLRHFGGQADVVGSRLSLAAPGSGETPRVYEIVGVAPPGFTDVEILNFRGFGASERSIAWIPLAHAPAVSPDDRRRENAVVVARITGSLAQAADELRGRTGAVADAAAAAGHSGSWLARSIEMSPVYYAPVSDTAEIAGFGALALSVPLTVLLIVCVNVAALRLAGGVARRHELAIRTSLGASRRHLVRLLVMEAGIVTGLSAAAAWGLSTQTLASGVLALPLVVTPDWRVLACAVVLGASATMLAGVWPALRSTGGGLLSSLAGGTRSAGTSNVRVYRWLVVVQMALSLVLVASALLAVRSAQTLSGAHLAELAGPVSVARLTFADSTTDESRRQQILTDLQNGLSALPGVGAVAVSTMSEVNVSSLMRLDRVGSAPSGDRRRQRTNVGQHGGYVSASYFDVFDLPVLEGRTFASDHEKGVVVITAAMRDYLRFDQAAVGTRLRIQMRDASTVDAVVIGVVGNAIGLAETRDPAAHTPIVFAPIGDRMPAEITLFTRSTDPRAVGALLSTLIKQAPTPLFVGRSTAMVDYLAGYRQPMVVLASVMGMAAAIAIGVAAMGLWAVAAIGVTRRRREFGVRLAVGADRAAIARMLLAESLRMSGIGILGGLLIAAPIFLLMRSEFVGVEPWDPLALAGTLGILGAATLAASVGPALRAARVDPLAILRTE